MRRDLEATPIKVITQRDNGSGVIEIPIMATASGAEIELDVEMMQQLVENFESFPVVPIGISPHQDFDERGGFAPGFIESISLRGNLLFGRLDLTAPLFGEVVDQGGWRGFSVEISHGLQTQAKKISGWVLTGGVFTNRPAVDAHFKIAAEGPRITCDTFIPIPHFSGLQENDMPENDRPQDGAERTLAVLRESHAAVEAEKQALSTRVNNLGDEMRTLKTENEKHQTDLQVVRDEKAAAEAKATRLETELRGVRDANRALQISVEDITGQLNTAKNENLAAKVLKVRDAALEAGVPPAIFEGIDADPAGWMLDRYANFDAFEATTEALSGVSRDLIRDVPKSGHDLSGTGDQTAKLSAESMAKFKRMGLDPKYIGIKSEGQLLGLDDKPEKN